MSVQFQCPACQTVRQVADRMLGNRVRCPDCDSLLELPLLADGAAQLVDEKLDTAPETNVVEIEYADEEEIAKIVPLQDVPTQKQRPVISKPVKAPRGRRRKGEQLSPEQALLRPLAPAPPPGAGLYDGRKAPPQVEDEADEDVDFGRDDAREDTEMDMTPMVDVTFLLLIFFMVTAAFSMQKSLEVPRPKDDEASTNVQQVDPEHDPEFVTVEIDRFNTYVVLTPDSEEEAPSDQELREALRRAREGDGSTQPTKLMIKAHGDSLHEKVVTAIDAGNLTKFSQIQVMTVEDE